MLPPAAYGHFQFPGIFCLPYQPKKMTLTCTTLDQHERKNYLRLIFTFHTLFDDMWCLLDFNSFPDTRIGHQLEFLLYEKKNHS